MKTWLISMDRIVRENECAVNILGTVAFLDIEKLLCSIISADAEKSYTKPTVLLAAG
jgi:hypothetical protein